MNNKKEGIPSQQWWDQKIIPRVISNVITPDAYIPVQKHKYDQQILNVFPETQKSNGNRPLKINLPEVQNKDFKITIVNV